MILANEASSRLATIIAVSALGVLIIIVIIVVFIERAKNEKVKKVSPYYLGIKKIFYETSFKDVNIRYTKDKNYLNTKRKFDSFNYSKRCTDFIRSNISAFSSIVDAIEYNKVALAKYNHLVNTFPHTNDEEIAKSIKMSLKSMVERETKLAKLLVKNPVTDYEIKISASYTSPKGRNSYHNSITFKYDFIKSIVTSNSHVDYDLYASKSTISFVQQGGEEEKPKKPEEPRVPQKVEPKIIEVVEPNKPKEKEVEKPKQVDRPTNSPKTGRTINSIDDLEEID